MLTAKTQEAIRWALARWLPGMRAACPGVSAGFPFTFGHAHTVTEPCPGYQPAPTTAEGLIDVGRLIRAIEAEGWRVTRAETDGEYLWGVYGDAYGQFAFDSDLGVAWQFAFDSDLGVAYLKARGDWPLKEDAHA